MDKAKKQKQQASEVEAHTSNLWGDPVEETGKFPTPQNPTVVWHVRRLGCKGFRVRQEAFQRELFRYGKVVRTEAGGITVDFEGVDMAQLDPYRFMRDEEGVARELVEHVENLEVDGNAVDYKTDPEFAVAAVVALFGQYPFIREWIVECATEVEERFQQTVGVAAGNLSDSSHTQVGEEETASVNEP